MDISEKMRDSAEKLAAAKGETAEAEKTEIHADDKARAAAQKLLRTPVTIFTTNGSGRRRMWPSEPKTLSAVRSEAPNRPRRHSATPNATPSRHRPMLRQETREPGIDQRVESSEGSPARGSEKSG